MLQDRIRPLVSCINASHRFIYSYSSLPLILSSSHPLILSSSLPLFHIPWRYEGKNTWWDTNWKGARDRILVGALSHKTSSFGSLHPPNIPLHKTIRNDSFFMLFLSLPSSPSSSPSSSLYPLTYVELFWICLDWGWCLETGPSAQQHILYSIAASHGLSIFGTREVREEK